MKKLTHLDDHGAARMVDVGAKPIQAREAVAEGQILLQAETIRLITDDKIAKGNVLSVARVAAIQGAKRTGSLIPLCHPLPLTHCQVDFEFQNQPPALRITARAKVAAQTGVEMEALTAVAIAALTIYDMCKAVDKQMVIERIRLISKTKV